MDIKINHTETNKTILTIQEVAEYFRVSIRTIREWSGRDVNFPKPFRKFGTLRFLRSEIEEYWQNNTRNLDSD
jgi:predicted DNA-binding transcriptional regulator AlpA